MAGRRFRFGLVAAALVVAAAAGLALTATDRAGAAPVTEAASAPAAAAKHCIEPTEAMRREHMDILMRERWATVHLGVRTPDRTIEACVTCHAVKGGDGKPVGADDGRHFCVSCHRKTGVSVDCFSCHRSTPASVAVKEGRP